MNQKIPFWRTIQFTYTIILVVGAICFIVAAFLIRADRDRQNQLIYSDRRIERQSSFDTITQLNSQSLKDATNDNTYWDEMVSFIENPSIETSTRFQSEVVQPQLDQYRAVGTWTYNTNFQLTSNTNKFPNNLKTTSLELNEANIKQIFSSNYMAHFYVQTQAGLMEVFGSTVHPSNDKDHASLPRGYYFIARTVDNTYASQLGDESKDRVEILTGSSVNTKRTDYAPAEGKIAFYKDMMDYQGSLIGQYYVEYDSIAISQVVKSFNRLFIITLVGYTILAFITYVLFGRLIIRPLNLLYRALSTDKKSPLKNVSLQRSEFGRIAMLMMTFFDQRDELTQVMKKQAATQLSLEKRSEELEHANHLMVNRELRMIELKQQIAELKKKNNEK